MLLGLVMLSISGVILYKTLHTPADPSIIYGRWVEVQVPKNRQEILTFSSSRVLRNDHLVASKFKFDGSNIYFETGEGLFHYEWNGSTISPQLERKSPPQPTQRLIKMGYEDSLNDYKPNKIGM